MTAVLLIAANRFFDRPDVERAAMGSIFHRAGSGAVCVLATLIAVFATYKTVDALAATHKTGVATHQQQVVKPVKTAVTRDLPKESVHFRRTDLLPGRVAHLPKKLPLPIAPPEKELVSLPKPIPVSADGELAILQDGESVGLGETPPVQAKPTLKKSVKKRKKRRRVAKRKRKRKQKNPLVIGKTRPDSPANFSTVDSASAPAPKRKIRGLTTESGGDTSGKSAACSSGHRSLANKACREMGAFSR